MNFWIKNIFFYNSLQILFWNDWENSKCEFTLELIQDYKSCKLCDIVTESDIVIELL